YSYKESKYVEYLKENVDLMSNLILQILDYDGKWIPVRKIPLKSSLIYSFDTKLLISEYDFAFPLRETRIMKLTYLPSSLIDFDGYQYEVDYDTFNLVYNISGSIDQIFFLHVQGLPTKLEFIPDIMSDGVENARFFLEREYSTATVPELTLEEGSPFTYLDLHEYVLDNIELKFRLSELLDPTLSESAVGTSSTSSFGSGVANQLIWIEVGWKPRAID
ncbi:unnamed protein product, partial [marine sediment metagenome]